MTQATRAKFKVLSVTMFENSCTQVNLHPVLGDSPENKNFWQYTPTGKIEMTITNPQATEIFSPGQEFFVDFTLATKNP
jgi:hypothetical protein